MLAEQSQLHVISTKIAILISVQCNLLEQNFRKITPLGRLVLFHPSNNKEN